MCTHLKMQFKLSRSFGSLNTLVVTTEVDGKVVKIERYDSLDMLMELFLNRLDCIVGVVQAETYEAAEHKVAENMTDYQCLSGLWEVDWENQASTSTWISR